MCPTSVAMPVAVTRISPLHASPRSPCWPCPRGHPTASRPSRRESPLWAPARSRRSAPTRRSPGALLGGAVGVTGLRLQHDDVPGTICSAGSSVISPPRRTLDLTIIIFCNAATLASALPSWRSARSALKRVRTIKSRSACCHSLMMILMIAAPSRTICIGSRYWFKKRTYPGCFVACANALGPYFCSRASALGGAEALQSMTIARSARRT